MYAAMDWSSVPVYLTSLAGVLAGTVSLLKWRSDKADVDQEQQSDRIAQAWVMQQNLVGQLEKRVESAEQSAAQAQQRATLADQRFLQIEAAHQACERRNIELTAMLELMRTVLNDRGIHIPAFGISQPDSGSAPHTPPNGPQPTA